MIQRIQTVYMLIAEFLIGTLFFVPFGKITGKGGEIYRVGMNGIFSEGIPKPEMISRNLPLIILGVVILIVIFMTILLFKNRKRQMKLTVFNMFLILALEGLIFYDVSSGATLVSGQYSMTLFSVFPIIATILIYLAYRSISKDEMLVRSIDRIR